MATSDASPDPEPPANELLPYIDRMLEAQTRYEMARLRWRAAKEKVDPDAFIVPIVTNEEKYTRYLSTLRWKRIRLVVLEEADGTCRGCSAEATQVHHRDYRPRVLKGDDLRPLVALCHTCHQRVHKDENGQRRASWNECERVLAELVSFRSEALGKSAAPGG